MRAHFRERGMNLFNRFIGSRRRTGKRPWRLNYVHSLLYQKKNIVTFKNGRYFIVNSCQCVKNYWYSGISDFFTFIQIISYCDQGRFIYECPYFILGFFPYMYVCTCQSIDKHLLFMVNVLLCTLNFINSLTKPYKNDGL